MSKFRTIPAAHVGAIARSARTFSKHVVESERLLNNPLSNEPPHPLHKEFLRTWIPAICESIALGMRGTVVTVSFPRGTYPELYSCEEQERKAKIERMIRGLLRSAMDYTLGGWDLEGKNKPLSVNVFFSFKPKKKEGGDNGSGR